MSARASAIAEEALERAQSSPALTNYPTIYAGFIAKGIPEEQIVPRVNVFTFHAWKAKGRSVKKGEHGVRIVTYIPCDRKERDPSNGEVKIVSGRRPKGCTVFHISQTQPTPPRSTAFVPHYTDDDPEYRQGFQEE